MEEKLDYQKLAKNFMPNEIKILLIGEAPPPNGKKYFYRIPENYSPSSSIEYDRSLPATIFNHYFGRRPKDEKEYECFLKCLKKRDIFLIDIINEPLKIRDKGRKNGINEDNIAKLLSNLDYLKKRIEEFKIKNKNIIVIFLLARNNYIKKLKEKFEDVSFITWKCFRLDIHEASDCNIS